MTALRERCIEAAMKVPNAPLECEAVVDAVLAETWATLRSQGNVLIDEIIKNEGWQEMADGANRMLALTLVLLPDPREGCGV